MKTKRNIFRALAILSIILWMVGIIITVLSVAHSMALAAEFDYVYETAQGSRSGITEVDENELKAINAEISNVVHNFLLWSPLLVLDIGLLFFWESDRTKKVIRKYFPKKRVV